MGWLPSRRRPPLIRRDEALGAVPVKNRHVRDSRLESGEAVLHYPVSAPPWAARIARWFGQEPGPAREGRLQLDALGTAVWGLIDGRRPVKEIAAAFAAAHQLEPREAETAVAHFMRQLGRRGLIGLR
ncbi:MAG: PqqD family protein [Desulfobacterales bacterium]|nr:PqqD family protein [Desulfobacterales bacterium]